MENARYTTESSLDEVNQGMSLDSETYISIGKRQTMTGMFTVVLLLTMFLTKPCYSYVANTAVFILNGIAISSLIGFTIEGLIMWNSVEETLSEDRIGEED